VYVRKRAIVHMDHIKGIDPATSWDGFAKMKCGLATDLSLQYVALLKEKLAG
jgi:hypothetical protein